MQNQQNKMRKEYLYTAFMCIGITVLIILLIVVGGCEPQKSETESKESESASQSSTSTESHAGEASKPDDEQSKVEITLPGGYQLVEYPSIGKMTGLLALTDVNYMSTIEVEPNGLANISENKSDSYGLSGYSLRLNEDAIKALNKMIESFEASKGENNLIVNEAYIHGSSLVDSPVRKDLSNGYTVNFSIWPPDEDDEDIGSGKYIWLVDNCTRFGYILRYPAEKQSFTQVTGYGTARVYRYVGYEHAAYMSQWHLCLEQYIDAVRNSTFDEPIVVSYKDASGDQKTCFVYYIPASEGEFTQLKIRGGEDTEYTVSGDGSTGFIITCYE